MKVKSDPAHLTPGYSAIQFFYWINFVTVSGYATVYLLHKGLANTQIGVIIGLACVIAAVLQPIVASYADHASSISIKAIVIACAAAAAGTACLLIIFGRQSQAVCGILFGICIIILEFMLPFINSLGTEMILYGRHINWGVARASGSIAYALMAEIMGVLVERVGAGCIPITIVVGFSVLIVCVAVYPFQKNTSAYEKPEHKTEDKSGNSVFSFFQKYPKFSILLIGITLAYTSHMLLNTFLFQIVESKGGSSVEMGRIMFICAIAELPPLLFFNLLLKKVNCDVWLRVSGIFLALKALCTFLAPDIAVLYGISVLQMVAWGFIAVSPVYYVNYIVSQEDRIKGQAYMAMTYTIGCVLSSFAGGKMLDLGGVRLLLICAVFAGMAGAVIMFIFSERLNLHQKSAK